MAACTARHIEEGVVTTLNPQVAKIGFVRADLDNSSFALLMEEMSGIAAQGAR